MYKYLYQYFAANHKASLPGIGSFNAETTSAELDFVNKSLGAPVQYISFHPEAAIADKRFIAFLSMQTGKNEQESATLVNHFSARLLQKLKEGSEEKLPGIGALKLEKNSFIFTPGNSVQQFFPAVNAERALRQDASHTIKVGEDERTSAQMHELLNAVAEKERWWITAVVLAAIGIAAIVYYHWLR